MEVEDEDFDVRAAIVRLTERMANRATREEMNNADFRTLQEFSSILERSGVAHREYVRDRVKESALETKNAIQDVEKHLTDKIEGAIAKASSAAAAAVLAAMPEKRSGWHPAVTYGGGGATAATALAVVLYFLTNGHIGGQ